MEGLKAVIPLTSSICLGWFHTQCSAPCASSPHLPIAVLSPLAAAAAAASPSALLPLAVFALLFMLQRIFHNAFILTCTLNILYVPLGRSKWPSPFGQRAATCTQRCLLGIDAQGMNSSFLTD